ncbi:MAG: hypothetical protein Q7K41_02970 [Dehalococcoidales bacterium]|nr:hypothetical protein [Dehalococcoidales bacterium]
MAESIDMIRLALFGESNVGKTHYGGQLLSRIETETCELKMRAMPIDLSPFEEVRSKLNAGLPASHTPSAVYRESVWPVIGGQGAALDLTWPDYGGEQVRQLIDTRRMGQEWLDRVQSAHGWILMVRPKLATQDDDIFSRPLGDVRRPNGDVGTRPHRSIQARLVELLQMLLHARSLQERRPMPALVVLLSCWDELGVVEGTKPDDVLKKRLPLLASFISSRWGYSKSAVFGLSALEAALSTERANEQFIDRGPEHFGYVIDPDGKKTGDLTRPIVRVAEMTKD